MHKYKHIAFLTLFFAGLISLFSINISAQKGDTQSNNLTDKVLQNYINISSLSMDERRSYFNDNLTAEDRANIFKFHLAFQFVKRPNLNKEQKDLILESISMISPDSYDKKKPQKQTDVQQKAGYIELRAKSAFSKQETYEIFANLGGDKDDIEVLKKYHSMTSLPTMNERRESFLTLSETDKCNLWKVQMTLHLAQPNLSETQSRVLLDAISLIAPEFYNQKKDTVEWQQFTNKLNVLESRIKDAFSKTQANEIFAKLGEDGKSVPTNNSAPICNCSNDSDWCSEGECYGGAAGCKRKSSGCGTWWGYPCDGLCSVA